MGALLLLELKLLPSTDQGVSSTHAQMCLAYLDSRANCLVLGKRWYFLLVKIGVRLTSPRFYEGLVTNCCLL